MCFILNTNVKKDNRHVAYYKRRDTDREKNMYLDDRVVPNGCE